jgi:hypothetical protein
MTERRGGSDVGQGTETVAVQQVRLRRSNRGVTGLDSLNLVPDPGFVLGSGSSPDPDPVRIRIKNPDQDFL